MTNFIAELLIPLWAKFAWSFVLWMIIIWLVWRLV
jgi:hypothetical protein